MYSTLCITNRLQPRFERKGTFKSWRICRHLLKSVECERNTQRFWTFSYGSVPFTDKIKLKICRVDHSNLKIIHIANLFYNLLSFFRLHYIHPPLWQFWCHQQNRTLFPLSGGEISLDSRHIQLLYIKILIGVGNNVGSSFNQAIRKTFPHTGMGNFCMTGFNLPVSMYDIIWMMTRNEDGGGGLYEVQFRVSAFCTCWLRKGI